MSRDIFEDVKEPFERPCFIVANGSESSMTWRDIFDTEAFDTLRAATYVSGAKFFADAIKGFRNVSIIIGIDNADVQRSFEDRLDDIMTARGDRFFEDLPDEQKRRAALGEIDVRYSAAGSPIHSKIYLLSSSTTGRTRLIVGSANMTLAAFGAIRQYEDVMAFDDSDMFPIYERRFEALKNLSHEFITAEKKKKYLDGVLVRVADLTADERTEKLMEDVRRADYIPQLSPEDMRIAAAHAEETSERAEHVKIMIEVTRQMSSKKKTASGETVVKTKSAAELAKQKPKIKEMAFRISKQEAEIDRFALAYDRDSCRLRSVETSQYFDAIASDDQISASLANIEAFIDAYQRFVYHPDTTQANLSRIYEIILYAYTSPFIFELRRRYVDKRANIHLVLVIGGRVGSGKSELLKYLDMILSGQDVQPDKRFIPYQTLPPGKMALGSLFLTQNVYPILIDEIPSSFFSSSAQDKGEELMKYLGNTLSDVNPTMICTTNAEEFVIPQQVNRRLYFLKVDCSFNVNGSKAMSESKEYLDGVLSNASNALFKDFCARWSSLIAEDAELMAPSSFDYLKTTRDIFLGYYDRIGRAVPSYFPMAPFSDYLERGRDMWRMIYMMKQDDFKLIDDATETEPLLSVSLKEIMTTGRDSTYYTNHLRPDLLKAKTPYMTTIRARPFFEWIGVKDPSTKRSRYSLWERIFGKR